MALEFTINPAQSQTSTADARPPATVPTYHPERTQETAVQRIVNETTDGELLRLVSHIQSRIRGMAPSALALLGEEQLRALKKSIDAADVKLRAKATKVKEAIAEGAVNGNHQLNHQLTVDDLMAFGEERLDELAGEYSYISGLPK